MANATLPPYPYGGPKNPLTVRAGIINNPLNVRQVPQNYNPAAHRAVSPNQIQFSPARLYDYVAWSAAAGVGATAYNFFGRSISGTVTQEDTNMLQPNNVGSGNAFMIEQIYVQLLLGVDYVSAGVEATIAAANAIDDYKSVMNRGVMQFYVNNVPQLGNGISPLLGAASPENIMVTGGVGAGVAAMQALSPVVITQGYDCTQFPFSLSDQLNFTATITFPGGAVTLPSANNTTKIGVVLKGRAYRPAG